MLPINSIYVYSVCTFIYKYSGTIFPAVINDLFIPTSTIHAHNTRPSHLYKGLAQVQQLVVLDILGLSYGTLNNYSCLCS